MVTQAFSSQHLGRQRQSDLRELKASLVPGQLVLRRKHLSQTNKQTQSLASGIRVSLRFSLRSPMAETSSLSHSRLGMKSEAT